MGKTNEHYIGLMQEGLISEEEYDAYLQDLYYKEVVASQAEGLSQ